MALTDFSTLAAVALAYFAYRIFWVTYGQRILVLLYPKHYAVWNGAAEPPTGGIWMSFVFLRRLVQMATSGEDLLDDIIPDGFRVAATVKRKSLLGTTSVLTIEPTNLQAMLATQFKDFATGSLRRGWLYPALGDSIFTSDGAFWEHSRALFRPQFSRDNINDLDATGKASDDLIAACGHVDTDGWTSDVALQPLFFNFTLDTATDFLFGESVNSQTAAIKKARGEKVTGGDDVSTSATSDSFLKSLDTINSYIMTRARLGSMYWLADGFRFRRALKVMKDWTENFVQLALQPQAQKAIKEQGKKSNVLSTLVTQCKDVKELRDQTLAILFAGRDTTASLLGWMFMRLSLNPEIYQKLREVVLAEFPPGKEITFSQLKGCRYLQHVVNESLRLHPTVPLNIRVATKDTTLPIGGGPDKASPIPVQKGQVVVFPVYVMHRRKDLWGEDALDFKPERWEQRVPAWHFLPFLGGPRICLGQQFALTEASYVLVRMVQQFDKISPADWAEMSRMKKSLGVTMYAADGVRVRLHKADA